MTNADVLDCERLLAAGPTENGLTVTQSIEQGVGPGAFDDASCAAPCSARHRQSMGATRQTQIARAAVRAHFEATLKGRSEAAVFRDVRLESPGSEIRRGVPRR